MAEFRAAERLVSLIESGGVPAEVLRQAALGTLSLPAADRLALLIYLARRDTPERPEARATLARLAPGVEADMLARPDCPRFLRALAAADGEDELGPELRELLAAAEGEIEVFALVEASGEERAALAAPAPAPAAAGNESLLARVAKMRVPERVRRALLGSREERMLLARDANRIVQRAVVTSPRLTESEVELIAAMRNVSDEVLRHIGQSRRWRQSPTIVKTLANNPRTPLEIGLNLVKFLYPSDLRLLAANKNVSETVRRAATKLILQRQA